MLRLGINISQMRNIPVTVVRRGRNNHVQVKLPSFGNMECEFGLKKSTQKGTKGQWAVVTVKNNHGGWFDL